MKDDFETLLYKLIVGTRKQLFVWRAGPSGDLYSLSLAKISIRIKRQEGVTSEVIEFSFIDQEGKQFDSVKVSAGSVGHITSSALWELVSANNQGRFFGVMQEVDGYALWANCDLTAEPPEGSFYPIITPAPPPIK
jgi:hypothetical protein